MKLKVTCPVDAEVIPVGRYVATLSGARFRLADGFLSDKRCQVVELQWAIEGYRQALLESSVGFKEDAGFTLTNRIAALFGRELLPDDEVDFIVSDDALTRQRHVVHFLDEYTSTWDARNDGVVGRVEDIRVGGVSLFGRSCFLVVIDESGNGPGDQRRAVALPRWMG